MKDTLPNFKMKLKMPKTPEHFHLYQSLMGQMGSFSGFMGADYGAVFRLEPPSLSTPYGKVPLLKQKTRKL